ncbi:MAG: pyridoxal phosphate-dependent aminotransferase [Candidatus Micrarchaeaceae archaeon]
MLAERVKYAINPIHEEDSLVEDLEKKGEKVIKLNQGDPAKYFPTPKYIIEALIKAVKEGKTYYSSVKGAYELREAIRKKYKEKYGLELDSENIVITQGVSEALNFINASLISKNDYAVIPQPYYSSYLPYLRIYGGKPIFLRLDGEDWRPDIDGLKKECKGKKVKYFLVNTPHNPTGSVLTKGDMEEIAEIAKEHDAYLFSDEIYDEIIFGGSKHTCIGEICEGDYEKYGIINGASKVYDSTGLRLGFIALGKKDELAESIANFASLRLSANTPSEYAYLEAIENQKEHEAEIRRMRNEIEKRVAFAAKKLNKMGLKTAMPKGAFYVFPRLSRMEEKEFVRRLLIEKKVYVSRGSGFGAPGYFRIVALADTKVLGEALERIREMLEA